MKKTLLLMTALAAFATLQAQWVDDPATNTFIANCGNDDGEIYLSTCPATGDTYVQWEGSSTNGWSPTLQRLNFEGVPQWGDDGIHIGGHQFSSMSEGVAMVSTADGGVVSCFAEYEGYTYAVKINPDGTFAWGEQGIRLFDGQGFSRTEIAAGEEGGFWALGSDYQNLFLQFVADDGTMKPTITISADLKCMFGQLTISKDNNVFVTYEQVGNGFYAEKEVHVVGYTTDGAQIAPDELLMSTQTFQTTYTHHAIADGAGGGYVYIWHPGINEAFNVYVFHFDEVGQSTISDLNGIPVHSADPNNFYHGASATVDPSSHDLIIAYEQTDAATQSQSRVYLNRITSTGEKVWGDGILLLDNVNLEYSELNVNAFEDGNGFSVVYTKVSPSNPYFTTVEAIGLDMDGNRIWSQTLCSSLYRRTVCENTTGFHGGQNIVAWVNATNGGLYGQNFGTMGELGEIGPTPPPVPCCYEPNNFDGTYYYDVETGEYGAWLTWEAPATGTPDYYKLYVTDPSGCTTTVEVAGDKLEYFDVTTVLGTARYQLTAVSGGNESGFATTSTTGEDYILISITGIGEHNLGEMTSVLRIFTTTGQCLKHNNVNKLSNGVYILQGLTQDGQPVSQKVVVNR